MSATAALAAVWLALRPVGPPETESGEARAVRIQTIAEAVVAETSDPVKQALVAATIEHEGQHFRLDVHEGSKLGDGGRAYCFGQVHRNVWLPQAELVRTVGVDFAASRLCVRAVLAAYDAAKCGTLERSITTYATGRGCGSYWAGAHDRLERVWYYIGVLRREATTAPVRRKDRRNV